jgi:ABC-type transport system involved in multi-copper enzyme maturation permease subunit
MPMRLGPGPVFAYERLTSLRRWQTYALRAVFVAAILVGLLLVQMDRPKHARGPLVSLRDMAVIGEQIYRAIALIELTLILLAAPAATVGAVCLDKARGTLDHVLATDLSNAEIVLGKLGARLIPVLGLIACTLPVLALSSLMGGIDPLALVGLFLVSIGSAFLGCSLAMMLSVYGRKTQDVVMMACIILFLWVMAPVLVGIVSLVLVGSMPSPTAGGPLWSALHEWLSWSNPYYLALAPYDHPGRAGATTYVGFLAASLLLSAVLLGLATARVRRVAMSQAGRPAAGGRRRLSRLLRLRHDSRPWLPGPSLDANPVAWREWHRARSSRMMGVAWGLYAALGLVWVFLAAWPESAPMNRSQNVGSMNATQVGLGLLLLSVGAATSLAEERARGSLDVLLSTPMPTSAILAGKWWGSFRRVLRVAVWPAATTAFVAREDGSWIVYLLLLALVLANGAAITSLGLAIATWVSRLGRAVAWCVTAYIGLVIGWLFLVGAVFRGAPGSFLVGLDMGDPPFGMLFLSYGVRMEGINIAGDFGSTEAIFWGFFWVAAYIGAAVLLFRATLATFDDCLGRIPDNGARPPSRPPGCSSLSSAELLALVPSLSEEFDEDPEGGDE